MKNSRFLVWVMVVSHKRFGVKRRSEFWMGKIISILDMLRLSVRPSVVTTYQDV